MINEKELINKDNTEYFNSNYSLTSSEESVSYMKDFWVSYFLKRINLRSYIFISRKEEKN